MITPGPYVNGGGSSHTTANLPPITVEDGDTILMLVSVNAFADHVITGPGPANTNWRYLGNSGATSWRPQWWVLDHAVAATGQINVTRSVAGISTYLVQVFKGVASVSFNGATLATNANPVIAPVITTIAPDAVIVWTGTCAYGSTQGMTVNDPIPSAQIQTAGNTHVFAPKTFPTPGAHNVSVAWTASGTAPTWYHGSIGLEPLPPAQDFTLSSNQSSISVNQQGSGQVGVTINPISGFAAPVTLSIAGLPSGVTAFWNPNPATGTSTLTLTASAAAVPGTASLLITGISGALSDSIPLSLTVVQTIFPSFSLSSYPSSLALKQGQSATATITVTPAYGFSGSVNLSATGLPTGVTAAFAPNPATGSAILTLTAAEDADVTTAQITIQGSSGSLNASTTMLISVSALRPPLDPALMRLATGLLLLKIPVEVPPQ